ncbi:carboxylesterase [Kordiimonas sp. SCSIO 12610]|uniref:alpha/beta hydrolase n=1 Tax=Kordiimonas sp. SCSIO 12610 TaxID=2829597 RepID=UPI00210E5AD2|nr:alpha/beta hydrolase [Kordiimonas sp. SCSIO 12610]UTW55549.1 alpha/beta hydrolase [Kordiimonas sp. SCSIO 12610]
MIEPKFIRTSHGTKIAYHKTPAVRAKSPGVVFLGGFMSDMEGSKALALEAMCKAENRSFVRFDYSGHGQSSGKFEDGTIGLWLKDALAVIDELTEGPQILVGSSMGGWISLLAAKARRARVAGFIGIAAAPDFTVRMWNEEFSDDQRRAILDEGFVKIPTEYGDQPYTITKALMDDGWQNRVVHGPIHLDVPVRLIQGLEDADVPWQTALNIADKLTGDDVDIILVPGGDHRLSTDHDLERLKDQVSMIAKKLT